MNSAADYKIFCDTERKKIDKLLVNALAGKKPASLYRPVSYILSNPGKRLRPLLVLLSAKAVSGSCARVYNAAVAVEMLHNFTLVHDDIMDNADKRRGIPTLHIKYDVNTAILAGDAMLAVAYETLLKDLKRSSSARAVEIFTRALVDVCEGQSFDKDFELRKSVALPEYIKMIDLKTAALASMCCALGAQIAGASERGINGLAAYGKNLGIAFQIQDDLLDVMGDEGEFGKAIGGDLVEGKKTYLFLRALAKAKGKDLAMLQKAVRNKGIPRSEVPVYKQLYIRLGVIEDASRQIRKYTAAALRGLLVLPKAERGIFIWLADSLIMRTK